ncbi:transferrin-binding protein-like solute binding protein [Sphingobium nicotianae]|uniref:Transferrin-binding protein B C-lobe/N-lobe beta barrel domain-containing protein n=1 Tax=Sphingobium nicotianae TaxID=2782607 RepID=A0A9X1IS56_9SPHN|nr:transferrin-binding protein-like solute binding protein [Sphingobium nicotianae]MBT2188067.1 hypothetical protein [Sphingobium nicotianae]
MGILKSETFDNNAANASGRFYADERPVENGQSALGALTIAYDANSQSYTITTAGRTGTFAPANLVVSGSADLIEFQKIGATSESLTLTKPGTTGALTYKYVGGGAWERATLASGVLDFTYDPFTYGAETTDSLVPRSGTGLYAVSLVGARAMEAPFAMAGSGQLQADFLNGSLTSSGVLTSIDVDTGLIKSIGIFFGEAAMSSGVNNFSGNFSMDDGKRFTGSWSGRFYGPAAEEVGAAWSLRSADGEVAAGYMLGRQDATLEGTNMALTQLDYDVTFDHRFSQLSYTDNGGGMAANPVSLRSDAKLGYTKATDTYLYADSARSISTSFAPTDKVVSESNSALTVYKMTGTDGITYKLSLNKPGAGNPTITLTYASFGHWERAQSAGADRIDRWFAYGLRTNGFQIPTGTGTFSGIIRGTAALMNGGQTYSLSGTSSFAMDFGAGTFTGSLNPIGTSLANGATRDFGTFAFDRGAIDIDAGLSADIVGGGKYLGFFEGALYGPKATEVGGTFGMQTENTDNGQTPSANAALLNGVIVGTRTGN